MKICYIANSANSHTVKWANHFLNLGHEVHVISHSNVNIPKAYVHYIDYNIKNFPIKYFQVKKLIKKIKPDIIHAQQANTCGLYAVSMKDYKVVVSAWGSDILLVPTMSILLKKMVQYVLKNAFYMTSDSYYMTKKMIELGADSNKIYTFPMGIEDSILKYRHEFMTEDKSLNIISDRRLEKLYNIDIIIKGFKLALNENHNLNLTIAADGTEYESLNQLTQALGISDKVKFIGRYNPDKVGEILEKNDVFVSVPKSDSTSVSLLESMYCGLYSIVSDLPANREWVQDKFNGLILNQVSEENIKDALLWCASNKNKLKESSEYNTELIKEKALWSNNAKIVENIYDNLFK